MWSPQQDEALAAVRAWLADRFAPQVFRLFGYAGTGKTTLAIEIAGMVGGTVLFGAFTGKAALVMRTKGCANASTIHSMIYKVQELPDGSTVFKLNPMSQVTVAKLVIIDECSMVDDALAHDLLSFGTKILVLGDPAQLPPVRGTGFFTEAEPNIMLTEVHRQARDNPIIRMSMDVREGRKLCVGAYGDSKIVRGRQDPNDVIAADQVLVGLNRTRRTCNARIRQLKQFEGKLPLRGERLICLRNNRERCLLNGGMWNTLTVEPDAVDVVGMKVQSLDNPAQVPVEVAVPVEFFEGTEEQLDRHRRRRYDEFDFGYAITVHKSQGSQWNSVMLFDESDVFRESRTRHLYTGITRAAQRITIVT